MLAQLKQGALQIDEDFASLLPKRLSKLISCG